MSTSPHLRRAAGLAAESLVAEHLAAQGYRILQRNIFTRFGEIDILAKQADQYVCVEVRSRQRSGPFAPELCLSVTKYRHLVQSLLSLAFLHNKPTRIDLVTVEHGKVARHFQGVEWSHFAGSPPG